MKKTIKLFKSELINCNEKLGQPCFVGLNFPNLKQPSGPKA